MSAQHRADLLLPRARLPRWLANFEGRHGPPVLSVADGALCGAADDGSRFAVRLPFGRAYEGPADLDSFTGEARPPERWGVLLVRKGGFAVARLERDAVVASKVGRRHVQGRTAAGGQSQQRFARRREQQARQAYAAAAEHAARILRPGLVVVTGGDRAGLAAVLADGRLDVTVVGDVLAVAEPRQRVLDAAVVDAGSVRMSVTDAPG